LALDADILFDNDGWQDAVTQELRDKDCVQPFSKAIWLDDRGVPYKHKQSWVKCLLEDAASDACTKFQAHGGFGLAFTRSFLTLLGGFFPFCVWGSGDEAHLRALAKMNYQKLAYLDPKAYFDRAASLHCKLGFADVTVRHLYHGELSKRKYVLRHEQAVKLGYTSACVHLESHMPEFLDPVWNTHLMSYFASRDEDAACPTPRKADIAKPVKPASAEGLLEANGLKNQGVPGGQHLRLDNSISPQSILQSHIGDGSMSRADRVAIPPNQALVDQKHAHGEQRGRKYERNNVAERECWGCGAQIWGFARVPLFRGFGVHYPQRVAAHDVLVDVQTGLFNRLRCTLAALWHVNQAGRGTIFCHWPLNAECSVPFQSFGRNANITWLHSKQEVLWVASNLPQSRILGELNDSAKAPGPLNVLKSLGGPKPSNFGDIVQLLQLQSWVIRSVRKTLLRLPKRPLIGLHIRKTDASILEQKLGKTPPQIDAYIQAAENHHAVLCSDDADVIRVLQHRLGEHRLSVLCDPRHNKSVQTRYGTRPDAGLNILIGALVLASCDTFMGTPSSSVSETILLWRKSEFLSTIHS